MSYVLFHKSSTLNIHANYLLPVECWHFVQPHQLMDLIQIYRRMQQLSSNSKTLISHHVF